MEEQQELLVTLLDEQGQPQEFELLMTFDYEGNRYAALLPAGWDASGEEDGVMLFGVAREGADEVFRPIESPILLEEVFAEFLALLDEQEEGEDAT